MKHIILTILLTLCLAINAQAVGLQIHMAGTTVSAAAATLTETLGQVTGNTLFGAGLYHFTGYQAVHSGTISSVDIGVQDDGNFQLIIMDAARNSLRSSTIVPVTVTTFGVLNVMTVTFPAVTINAGEYIGYYYSGMTYALIGAGGQTYYRYGSPPPNLLATGYLMDILARINYAPPSYSVAASPGTNGTLDATTPSPVSVTSGATTSFKFNANSGYYVSGVSGCNGTAYSNSTTSVTSYTYTTGAISGACTVNATFASVVPVETLGATTATLPLGRTAHYHNTGLTPVHSGTISSVDFSALSGGSFYLVITNASNQFLRFSNTVTATAGLQTLTFTPVTINAGEYVAFYHAGDPHVHDSPGWVTYFGSSWPPSTQLTGYKYSLLVRVDY